MDKQQKRSIERAEAFERLEWMLGTGLTRTELAERLGMKQQDLSELILHGPQRPNSPSPVLCKLIGYVYRERQREIEQSANDGEPVLEAVAA